MKHKNHSASCGFHRQQLLVDFKDSSGADKNADVFILRSQQTTDEAIVWALKAQIEQSGGKLSAISDGLHCLYLAPGILEETTRELGLPFPADKKAALEYVGLDPVNKAELIAEWSKNGQ